MAKKMPRGFLNQFDIEQRAAVKLLKKVRLTDDLVHEMDRASAKVLRKFFKSHNVPLTPPQAGEILSRVFVGDNYTLQY